MSKIIDDFKVFQDVNGLNQLNPGEVSQNGALFTVEYLITLLADSTSSDEEKRAEIARILELFKTLEPEPGLTIRFTGSTEFESMDNTVAFLTFSALNDCGRFARRLEARGDNRMKGVDLTQAADANRKTWPLANALAFWRGPKHVWNNQNPDLYCQQGWWGRSPAMLGLINMTQGKSCSPFLWLSVLVGQFLGCTSDMSNTDSRKLSYVTWQFLKTRSFFWKMAYKVWCSILMKYCPNGMNTIYAIYYRNSEHPLHTYSKPFID